ncbi:hypothetical protein K437DRAFT_69197 [Tilletiaria anomala UBC 951]|uniref:Protein Zds1 C-terminal domain-containing protein n=1 Tax=Tilletiaria anomala (strain ATCC 24038 / CBS 436.72 / UBC 951) TaxID=1037660 RepID=A0A066WQV5_TILAU|nr:uncharacterized protein K437DRAFT_69197 [Tilletiaria anomala UBC 951]KDN53364.1 hypothetical protein K437DRAFT_69197 [Tilletiaria anomala UBC 951]
MQNITDSEFAREVEALKAHRRESVNRHILDPDLPDLAAVLSGSSSLPISGNTGGIVDRSLSAVKTAQSSTGSLAREGVGLSDNGPVARGPGGRGNEGRQRFTARRRGLGSSSNADGGDEEGSPSSASRRPQVSPVMQSGGANNEQLDPSHLFWVPASMHPEVSPSDFRKFLHEHASRAVREAEKSGQDGPDGQGSAGPASVSGDDVHPALQGIIRRPSNSISGSGSLRADLISRSTSLSRRASTLRRQYRPEIDTDTNDDDKSAKSSAPKSPLARSSSKRDFEGPMLTLEDLQKLEQLAEEASKAQDPSALRSALHRTISMGSNASALDRVDDMPAEVEDADSPIILPRPGQILRRAARTKIRKTSFGEGQRRPSRRRTGAASGSVISEDTTASAVDLAAMPRGDSSVLEEDDMQRTQSGQSAASGEEEGLQKPGRPLSDEATESIVDAYSRDSYLSDASQRTSVTSLTESVSASIPTPTSDASVRTEQHSAPLTPTQGRTGATSQPSDYFDMPADPQGTLKGDSRSRMLTDIITESPPGSPVKETPPLAPVPAPAPAVEHDMALAPNRIFPVHVQHVPPQAAFEKTRPAPLPPPPAQSKSPLPPSPEQPLQPHPHTSFSLTGGIAPVAPKIATSPALASQQGPIVPAQQQQYRQQQQKLPPPSKSKEKEKKSGFASWFGLSKDDDEDSKKAAKLKKKEDKEKMRADDEGSSGFLGSLFGKKKGSEEPMQQLHQQRWNNNQITAGSLLDRNVAGGARLINNHYRYPIHVERAVYRLSHIKLANPRRPLYEQVLISNLMFWYLSIINRSSTAYGAPTGELVQGAGNAPGTTPPVEIERTEEAEQHVNHKPAKSKKSGLVKPNRAPPGRNTAEMPIAAAGYGKQHRQINSEMALQQQGPQHNSFIASQYNLQSAFHSSQSSFTPGQVVDAQVLQGGHGTSSYADHGINGVSDSPPATYAAAAAATSLDASQRQQQQQQKQRWSDGSGSDKSTSPEVVGQRVTGRGYSEGQQHNVPEEFGSQGKRQGPGLSLRRVSDSVESGAWLGGNGSGTKGQRRAVSPVESEHAWLGSASGSGGGSNGTSGPSGGNLWQQAGLSGDAFGSSAGADIDHRRNLSEPIHADFDADARQRMRASDPSRSAGRGGATWQAAYGAAAAAAAAGANGSVYSSPDLWITLADEAHREFSGGAGQRSVSEGSVMSAAPLATGGHNASYLSSSTSDPTSLGVSSAQAAAAVVVACTPGMTTNKQQQGKAVVATRRSPSPSRHSPSLQSASASPSPASSAGLAQAQPQLPPLDTAVLDAARLAVQSRRARP